MTFSFFGEKMAAGKDDIMIHKIQNSPHDVRTSRRQDVRAKIMKSALSAHALC